MKKFYVQVHQSAFREGTYQIEAPDVDAAYVLAADIKLDDPRINWNEEFILYGREFPRPEDIEVFGKGGKP